METKNEIKLQTPLELMRKRGEWFQKVFKKNSLKQYLDAGKAAGYIVKKDNMSFQINDDETGEIVMNGMCLNAAFWLVVLSKKYWVEPIGRDYRADQLEA
jgi:hypothetical protein